MNVTDYNFHTIISTLNTLEKSAYIIVVVLLSLIVATITTKFIEIPFIKLYTKQIEIEKPSVVELSRNTT